MIKRRLAAAAVFMLAATPALAGHCPKDVRAIDAALENSKLDQTKMSEVKKLRDKGNQQHQSGGHAASLKSLHKAMAVLGVGH